MRCSKYKKIKGERQIKSTRFSLWTYFDIQIQMLTDKEIWYPSGPQYPHFYKSTIQFIGSTRTKPEPNHPRCKLSMEHFVRKDRWQLRGKITNVSFASFVYAYTAECCGAFHLLGDWGSNFNSYLWLYLCVVCAYLNCDWHSKLQKL